jgi:hypothetical protein
MKYEYERCLHRRRSETVIPNSNGHYQRLHSTNTGSERRSAYSALFRSTSKHGCTKRSYWRIFLADGSLLRRRPAGAIRLSLVFYTLFTRPPSPHLPHSHWCLSCVRNDVKHWIFRRVKHAGRLIQGAHSTSLLLEPTRLYKLRPENTGHLYVQCSAMQLRVPFKLCIEQTINRYCIVVSNMHSAL